VRFHDGSDVGGIGGSGGGGGIQPSAGKYLERNKDERLRKIYDAL